MSGFDPEEELSLETGGGRYPVLTIDTGAGGVQKVPQGDMSDAAFAALAKQSQDAGTLVSVDHADGSKTKGDKGLLAAYKQGTGEDDLTPLNLPPSVQDQGDQTGMPTNNLKFGAPTAPNPFPGQVVQDQGDQTGMPMNVKEARSPFTVPGLPVIDPGIPPPAPGVDLGMPPGMAPLHQDTPREARDQLRAEGRWPGSEPGLSPSGDYGAGASARALQLGTQAAEGMAGITRESAQAMAQAHVNAMGDLLQADAARKTVEQGMAKRAEEYMAANAKLDKDIEDAVNQKVDPRHFFNSMDTGQQVMAVLAGACFGAVGQGMQWLQHVKSLVDQDIDVQKTNYENRVKGLQLRKSNLRDAYAMSREAGLDGIAASERATASTYQMLALTTRLIQNNATAAGAKYAAQQAESALWQKHSEHMLHANQAADSFNIHKANLELEYLKLGMSNTMQKPPPMTDKEMEDFANLKNGVDDVIAMKTAYRKARDVVSSSGESRPSWQMANKLERVLPNAWSDANQYEDTIRRNLGVKALKALYGSRGIDRLEEVELRLKDHIPSVRESSEEAESKLAEMDRSYLSKYTNEYNTFMVKNPYYAAQLEPPERVKARLEAASRVEALIPKNVTRGSSRGH